MMKSGHTSPDPAKPRGLRETQKHERRQRILDAAERLMRKTGGPDFSIRVLAAEAGVSFATPFNLFGSKEGLLYALLARSLDTIIVEGLTFRDADPAMHAIEAAENAVAAFLRDPEFLRPLYLVLLSVAHPVHRPLFMQRTYAYWQTAMLSVPAEPSQTEPARLELVTGALMAHFIGLLELWVHRDISDSDFRARAVFGVLMAIQPITARRNREKLDSILSDIQQSLSRPLAD